MFGEFKRNSCVSGVVPFVLAMLESSLCLAESLCLARVTNTATWGQSKINTEPRAIFKRYIYRARLPSRLLRGTVFCVPFCSHCRPHCPVSPSLIPTAHETHSRRRHAPSPRNAHRSDLIVYPAHCPFFVQSVICDVRADVRRAVRPRESFWRNAAAADSGDPYISRPRVSFAPAVLPLSRMIWWINSCRSHL